jgi:hypothetical protein
MRYQQGDVLLESARLPKSAKKSSRVLKEGETTGHKHVVVGDAEVFELDGVKYVCVGSDGATLTHEEHGPIMLPANKTFKMLPGVFEYDYEAEEAKRVVD